MYDSEAEAVEDPALGGSWKALLENGKDPSSFFEYANVSFITNDSCDILTFKDAHLLQSLLLQSFLLQSFLLASFLLQSFEYLSYLIQPRWSSDPSC